LLDVQMPRMDGFAVVKAVRSGQDAGRDLCNCA
jgi:CheY-like chemotaxis protein